MCVAFTNEVFPDAKVDELVGSFMRLKTENSVNLADTFEQLEKNKEMLGIEDYSVSQATLEQVFIDFAKDQEEERGGLPLFDKPEFLVNTSPTSTAAVAVAGAETFINTTNNTATNAATPTLNNSR